MKECQYCHGFGYVQMYCTTVVRVYCDCSAGDARVEEVRKALEEEGLDPDSPSFRWTRRSDIMRLLRGEEQNGTNN